MDKKRKAIEAEILRYIARGFPGEHNTNIYKALFARISDKDFKLWMTDLRSGKRVLNAIVPNLSKVKITAENMVKLSRELGFETFQRLWLTDQSTGIKYLTPIKYMVLRIPIKRQSQHLEKGISTPKSNKSVDEVSGQPTGESAGSRISPPEIMTLYATGMSTVIDEFLSVRGGNPEAFRVFEKSLRETGEASLADAHAVGGDVRSSESLSAFLYGMHIDNNYTRE